MTRKDYVNIAAAILATQVRIKNAYIGGPVNAMEQRDLDKQLRGVRRAAASIADFLKDDNPANFDPALFLRNCGY